MLQMRNNGKVNLERSWEDYVSGLRSSMLCTSTKQYRQRVSSRLDQC